jgi:hypothetical protein
LYTWYSFYILNIYFPDILGFSCPKADCRKIYKSKNALYTHLKYECGMKPQFKCDLCTKSFKQPGSFKCHMITKHKQLV